MGAGKMMTDFIAETTTIRTHNISTDFLPRNYSNANTTSLIGEFTTEDAYDSRGAMLFTIAVIVIYGSSILAFIAYSVKSSSSNSDSAREDREVEKFLTSQGLVDKLVAAKEVKESRKNYYATGLIHSVAVPLRASVISVPQTVAESGTDIGPMSSNSSSTSLLSDNANPTCSSSLSDAPPVRRQLILPEPSVLLTIPG